MSAMSIAMSDLSSETEQALDRGAGGDQGLGKEEVNELRSIQCGVRYCTVRRAAANFDRKARVDKATGVPRWLVQSWRLDEWAVMSFR